MDQTEEGDEEILIDENEVIESETDEPMPEQQTGMLMFVFSF